MNPVLGLSSCFSDVEKIPMLNGENFSEWKEHLLLLLGLMDLDISLREVRPGDESETKHWDRSDRMSIMIMRIGIPQELRGVVPKDVKTAREYLAAVEKCYAKDEMTDIPMLTSEFRSGRMKPNENVRQYLMRNMSLAAKIKKLGMDIPDVVVAEMLLDSLPSEYDQLRTVQRFRKNKWSTHELISHCAQLEESLKWEKKERDLAAGKAIFGKKRKNYQE